MKLTVAEHNALVAECGCCGIVRCCKPLKDCRGISGYAQGVGYLLAGSDSLPQWQQTYYQDRVSWQNGADDSSASYVETDVYPGTSTEYVASTRSVDWVITSHEKFDRKFTASLCNETTGPATVRSYCTATGGELERRYDAFDSGSPGSPSWSNFLSYELATVYSDAEGEVTDEWEQWVIDFAAWEAAHPDPVAEQAAYDAAYAVYLADLAVWDAAYLVYLAAYAAYEADYATWESGGMEGDPPVEPDAPADAPIPPTPVVTEPPEPGKFYPPCYLRKTFTRTLWERVDGVVQLVPGGSDPGTENPYVYHSVGPPGALENGPTLSGPVTYEEFVAMAEEWFTDHAEAAFANSELSASDSEYCPASTVCGASKFHGMDIGESGFPAIRTTVFQYRWKLDKCCTFKEILSGWREVYFPLEYILWHASLALLGSGDPIPPVPVDLDALATKRQWLWSGTPPGCFDSNTSDSIDPAAGDHYDHEPMWSPWSLTVAVPTGEQGRIVLDTYWQKCNGPLIDVMPEVTGERNLSDEIPDEPA